MYICGHCGARFNSEAELTAHIREAHPEWMAGTAQTALGQQEALNQAYINWLKAYYRFQNPDDFDEMGIAKGNTKKLLNWTADQLDAGVSVYSMPFFNDFLESYQGYAGLTGGTSEELAYATAQTDYLKAQTQQILDEISRAGQITPSQQAQLDFNLKQLEAQINQYGITNEQARAELELSRQQLEYQKQIAAQEQAQAYNEWLTQLQANPATWVERWYAERLPQGGAKIPLQSGGILAQGPASPYIPWGQNQWQIPMQTPAQMPAQMPTQPPTASSYPPTMTGYNPSIPSTMRTMRFP